MASGVLLVGCGKMGGALLDGWLVGSPSERFTVVEPGDLAAWRGHPQVLHCAHADALPTRLSPNIVMFAVKPQVIDAVVAEYRSFVQPDTVFLSIAAGIPLERFARLLGPEAAVVRAMPNTPSAVGRGMTVALANDRVTPDQIDRCDALLRAVGDVAWLTDESLIDAVTAVSGSGPAYVFLVAETLARAGVAAGLPEDLAHRLARATVAGAGELLHRSIESAATLRKNVTSPNGVTQAALAVLMADDGLAPLLERAVQAAAARSRELAG